MRSPDCLDCFPGKNAEDADRMKKWLYTTTNLLAITDARKSWPHQDAGAIQQFFRLPGHREPS